MASNKSTGNSEIETAETEEAIPDAKRPGDTHQCKICSEQYRSPCVLSCLHVFCQACLDEQLVDKSGDFKETIVCPECQQETKVASNGAALLPCDYVTANILDLFAIQAQTLFCSSCTTNTVAMSGCEECALYLCIDCYSTHQATLHFENHAVVLFSDVATSSFEPEQLIHKPVFCGLHIKKKLSFFCSTCEVPLCDECVLSDHRNHHLGCRSLEEVYPVQRDQLKSLFSETESKSAEFNKVTSSLEEALGELQRQHETAEQLILQKYEDYKANLERCKEESLEELKQLRTEQESILAGLSHTTERTTKKVEGAFNFTSQLLRYGNMVEILSLKEVVSAQLLNIISELEPTLNFSLDLDAKVSAFDNSVQAIFKPTVDTSTAEDQPEDFDPDARTFAKLKELSIGDKESELSAGSGGALPRGDLFNQQFSVDHDVDIHVWLKFGRSGASEGEFNTPRDLCVGWEGDIVVADTKNHRVQVFDKNGRFKFRFGRLGKADGKLYHPSKIAAFRDSGNLVVGDCAYQQSRLQVFTRDGWFVMKIGTGSIITVLAGLAVTLSGDIVLVDKESANVFYIDYTGEVLLQFNCADYVMEPSDIVFWGNEFYLSDFWGHAVVVFGDGGIFKRRIERTEKTEWFPSGVFVTDSGVVIVGDSHNSRFHVIVFSPQGEEMYFLYCPDVRVSGCSGLKLTPEGNVATVCRNGDFVLVVSSHRFLKGPLD